MDEAADGAQQRAHARVSGEVRWQARADGRGVTPVGGRAERSGRALSLRGPAGSSEVMRLWPEPLNWARLTRRERDAYEIGFLTGFLMREDEVAQANADADRYYRAAFDRQHGRRRR